MLFSLSAFLGAPVAVVTPQKRVAEEEGEKEESPLKKPKVDEKQKAAEPVKEAKA